VKRRHFATHLNNLIHHLKVNYKKESTFPMKNQKCEQIVNFRYFADSTRVALGWWCVGEYRQVAQKKYNLLQKTVNMWYSIRKIFLLKQIEALFLKRKFNMGGIKFCKKM
jgi:hypothetical protein